MSEIVEAKLSAQINFLMDEDILSPAEGDAIWGLLIGSEWASLIYWFLDALKNERLKNQVAKVSIGDDISSQRPQEIPLSKGLERSPPGLSKEIPSRVPRKKSGKKGNRKKKALSSKKISKKHTRP